MGTGGYMCIDIDTRRVFFFRAEDRGAGSAGGGNIIPGDNNLSLVT